MSDVRAAVPPMSNDGPGIGVLIGLGVTLAAYLGAGFGLGWLVDLAVGSFPVFAFVGLVLGLVPAGATVYRLSKKYM